MTPSRGNSVSRTKVGPDSSPLSANLGNGELSFNTSEKKSTDAVKVTSSVLQLRRVVDVMSKINDSEEHSNGTDDIEKNISKTTDGNHLENLETVDNNVQYCKSSAKYALIDFASPIDTIRTNYHDSTDDSEKNMIYSI